MDTQARLPRLQQQSLPNLAQSSLSALSKSSLPAIQNEDKVLVVNTGEYLIKSNGPRLDCWHRKSDNSWRSTIRWHDGTDELIEIVHMSMVDRTLVLMINNGEFQLWKTTKNEWEMQLRTTFAGLEAELVKSNKRSIQELAFEHRYSIAMAIAVVVAAGAYHVYQMENTPLVKTCAGEHGGESIQVRVAPDTSSNVISSESVRVTPNTSTTVTLSEPVRITPNTSTTATLSQPVRVTLTDPVRVTPKGEAYGGVLSENRKEVPTQFSGDIETSAGLNQPVTISNGNAAETAKRFQNSVTPDKLTEVTRVAAQDVNNAVYGRRHQELGEQYAKELKAATNARTKAEINNKINSLRTQEFMDTVSLFSRKDGSEVFVTGNVKTRTATAKHPRNIRYADDGYGWTPADKRVVVDTIRNKPEFRNAKIHIIDVDKASNAQQNAVRHAEMQFMSHCKQAKLNPKEYVGGISKPACISCERVLSPNIRALGDGIIKNSSGLDQIPDPEALDSYSGRTLSRYAVKEKDWKPPCSVGTTHEIASSKKITSHNVSSDTLYSAKPQLTKPNIRKETLTNPVATAKRQTPNSIHKNVKKHVGVNSSLGGAIENIIENYDRPGHAEAKTLIHNKPHTYQTRSTVGAQASLHTARAHAHINVAQASAEGPNLSVGAHAGPAGASAYAKAEVCRAEASVPGLGVGVGLTAKTGVEVGPGGLSVDILGFGFTIGPKFRVALPVADVTFGV